jgi:cell division protein FtsB
MRGYTLISAVYSALLLTLVAYIFMGPHGTLRTALLYKQQKAMQKQVAQLQQYHNQLEQEIILWDGLEAQQKLLARSLGYFEKDEKKIVIRSPHPQEIPSANENILLVNPSDANIHFSMALWFMAILIFMILFIYLLKIFDRKNIM